MIDLEAPPRESAGLSDEELAAGIPGPTRSLGLIRALQLLALEKRLVALVTGTAVLIGVIYSLLLPVQFTATTRLLTPQQTPSAAALMMNQMASPSAGALAAAAGAGLSLRNPNDTYIGLLNSRPVADAIIRDFTLADEYRTSNMTSTRKALAENTFILSEKSGFLAISVKDKDKQRAADIANSYTKQLLALTNSIAITEASRRRLFYESELKRAKEDLVLAQSALQKIQQEKGMVQLEGQAKVLFESDADLHAKIAAKQVELKSLRSFSTEQNPNVQLALNQLGALQAEADQLEQNNRATGSSFLGMHDLAGTGIDYLRAQHELLYRQTLYDLLMRQYDGAKIDEAKDAAIIQVVEPAIAPDQKSAPHRSQIVVLFAFLGALGACFFLLGKDHLARNAQLTSSLRDLCSTVLKR